tara:strand:+ start:8069 stop:8326 length:258 start_codon:yes stop_codon:yes gene_type:complete
MELNIFKIIAVIGLILIISGTLIISSKIKNRRKYAFPKLLIGGICLLIYSIYIRDTIFIILQSVYIIITVYGLIKINKGHIKILN